MFCLTVVASVVTATAQGTFNLNNNYVPSGATDKAYVLDMFGKPASVEFTRIEFLLHRPNLNNGFDYVLLFPATSLTLDGLFFMNGLMTGGNVGDTCQITIRAWDIRYGSPPDKVDNSLRNMCNQFDRSIWNDETVVTINNLGGGVVPPATLGLNSDFRGLDFRYPVVPEPSTYALMALGLIGVFFINKRK